MFNESLSIFVHSLISYDKLSLILFSLFSLLVLSFLGLMDYMLPLAFVTGGVFSALAGFFGMKIATASNARTAWAAKEGLNSALTVAFSAGSVMGFVVFGLGLLA